MYNKMQKLVSQSVNKAEAQSEYCISGRWMNINNGVKRWEVIAFVCCTKTETMSDGDEWFQFNFTNEMLFVSFTAIITTRSG